MAHYSKLEKKQYAGWKQPASNAYMLSNSLQCFSRQNCKDFAKRRSSQRAVPGILFAMLFPTELQREGLPKELWAVVAMIVAGAMCRRCVAKSKSKGTVLNGQKISSLGCALFEGVVMLLLCQLQILTKKDEVLTIPYRYPIDTSRCTTWSLVQITLGKWFSKAGSTHIQIVLLTSWAKQRKQWLRCGCSWKRHWTMRRPSHRSSVGKSIAKRMPGTALWEDLLIAVLLGKALQRGYPAQLFGKTFSLQFCWEEHCKEDARNSSLGRLSHCSFVMKSIAKRMPGTALWEDLLFAVLLGKALQRGCPAQLFGKTFSLQLCWEEHCKEDARNSSLGRPSHRSSVGKSIANRIPGTALCSSVGKSIAKRMPGTALWEDLLFAVLLGRALQRGYPAQLFGKTFSLQFCWEEHCKEDTRPRPKPISRIK